ncbi:MAG TPA: hypothetical protein VGE52_08390, partial [Pirellulales bacterium]
MVRESPYAELNDAACSRRRLALTLTLLSPIATRQYFFATGSFRFSDFYWCGSPQGWCAMDPSTPHVALIIETSM